MKRRNKTQLLQAAGAAFCGGKAKTAGFQRVDGSEIGIIKEQTTVIMFWNRKEVFVGYIGDDFYHVMGTLKRNKIKYFLKTVDIGNQAGLGSMGENPAYKQACYVYVHKNDFEAAEFLINKDRPKH